jgi:hypothetical protein
VGGRGEGREVCDGREIIGIYEKLMELMNLF